MFEKASRIKIRFASSKGMITVEDLWDLSLENLNSMAKEFNKKIKAEAEEDFLKEAKTSNTTLKLGFGIVLHVLNTKKAEKEARESAAAKDAEAEKLMGALARKQDASLENLSEEELKAKIAALKK